MQVPHSSEFATRMLWHGVFNASKMSTHTGRGVSPCRYTGKRHSCDKSYPPFWAAGYCHACRIIRQLVRKSETRVVCLTLTLSRTRLAPYDRSEEQRQLMKYPYYCLVSFISKFLLSLLPFTVIYISSSMCLSSIIIIFFLK